MPVRFAAILGTVLVCCSAAFDAKDSGTVPATSPATQPAPSFTLGSIIEIRIGGPLKSPSHDSALLIVLKYTSAEEFHTVESVNVEQAVDDTGAELKLAVLPPLPFSFARVPANGGVHLPYLTAPARRASRITNLTGRVRFTVGGEKHTATWPHVKSFLDKHVYINFNGHTLEFMPKLIPRAQPKALSVIVYHPKSELEAALTAGDGTVISTRPLAPMPFGIPNSFAALPLPKPLDDTMTLQFTGWTDQKTVDVPFELKDVPLP